MERHLLLFDLCMLVDAPPSRASQVVPGKESACQCRRYKRCRFSVWVGKISSSRKWQPTPVFLPWTEEPDGIQFMGLQRAGHNWVSLHAHTNTHTHIFIWQRTVKGRFWTITWKWKLLSCVWLIVTPRTIQSMEFSRPEHWSGPLFPSPGDLPNPGIEPRCPVSQEDSLPAEPPGKP